MDDNMPEGAHNLPGSPYYEAPDYDMCICTHFETPCTKCGIMCPKKLRLE